MANCDGGFDANFVTDIHDLLKCVVCNFVLKNPVHVIECGHRFCRECYEKMKEYALTRDVELLCPMDRLLVDEKQVFPDKGIERRILDLQVKCDHFNDGCEWINELRHLQDHINNKCLFALLCCPNDGCNINSVRSELEEHKKICPMKEGSPAQTIRKLETMMSEVMETLKAKDDQLDALTVQMKENEMHLKTMEKKLEVLDKTIDDDKKYQGLRKVNTLKRVRETKLLGYFQWNITDYCQKRLLKRIESLPFSTLNGYKCALRAVWSGLNDEHFGISIYLKAGERDDDLVWPFNLKVTFECCNEDDKIINSMNHLSCVERSWRSRPDATSTSLRRGYPKFLSYPRLTEFIKDDSIVINCYIETMNEQ